MDRLEEHDCIMFDLYNAWEDGRARHRVIHERHRYGLQDVGGPVHGAHKCDSESLHRDVDETGAPDLALGSGED